MNIQARTYARWMAAVAPLFVCEAARACATCFGDPNHPMSKGALAGVAVLGGFIGFVFIGAIGTGLFWMHRSRKLARRQRYKQTLGCDQTLGCKQALDSDHASGTDHVGGDPS